jgi:hypothetical protein
MIFDFTFYTVNSFLPYVGWVTIVMTEKPIIKVRLYWFCTYLRIFFATF